MKTNVINLINMENKVMDTKVGVIFHSIDFDGYASAAIIKLLTDEVEIKLLPWKHGDECPVIDNLDYVFVLDLTLPTEWMIENQDKIIWVDHHESAVRALRNLGFDPMFDGCGEGIGACQLLADLDTSGRFKGNKVINMIATYDTFRKDGKYASWEDAWNFQLYLGKQYNTRQLDPLECVEIAEELIKKDTNYINFLIGMGECMEEKRAADEAVLFKTADKCRSIENGCKLVSDAIPSIGIRTHLEAGTNSVFFMRRMNPLDNGLYLVSIRVPESSNFNATEFAKQYGGGGHIKASGCSMTLEQWEAL